MTTNRPLRVFLCHSSADKPAVRELYEKLRAEPWIEPWLDEENIFPGDDWDLEIKKAIRETDAIIVCLSKGSITKEGYVQREIKTALDYSDEKPEGTTYIIPIRLEECKPPERLSKWQYADYFSSEREKGWQKLIVSLKRRNNSIGLLNFKDANKEEQKIKSDETNSVLVNYVEPKTNPVKKGTKQHLPLLEQKNVNEYTYESKLIFALGIVSAIMTGLFILYTSMTENFINIGLLGAVVPIYNAFLAKKEIDKDNDRELRNRLRGIGVILTWMSLFSWLLPYLFIIPLIGI